MKQKAVLIDGHNFLFRGFYGVPLQVKRSDGTQINAVYGFFSLLRAVVKKIDPKYLVVVFDSETSADKKKLVNVEYKANRIIQDNTIFEQLTFIKNCLDIMGISWVEDEKNEADDVIATLSEKFVSKNIEVLICSNDQDFFQLIGEGVFVLMGSRGELVLYDTGVVFQKFGIYPYQFVDYLSLVGDASDNIKGVRGLGNKRSVEILSVYKDIVGIYLSFGGLSLSFQRLLEGKEEELGERRDFLKIDSKVKLANRFLLKNFQIKNGIIPEKMGEFLTLYWDKIV